jgi:hypothetical protein
LEKFPDCIKRCVQSKAQFDPRRFGTVKSEFNNLLPKITSRQAVVKKKTHDCASEARVCLYCNKVIWRGCSSVNFAARDMLSHTPDAKSSHKLFQEGYATPFARTPGARCVCVPFTLKLGRCEVTGGRLSSCCCVWARSLRRANSGFSVLCPLEPSLTPAKQQQLACGG